MANSWIPRPCKAIRLGGELQKKKTRLEFNRPTPTDGFSGGIRKWGKKHRTTKPALREKLLAGGITRGLGIKVKSGSKRERSGTSTIKGA